MKVLPKTKKDLKTGEITQTVLIPNSTPAQVYRALLSSKIHSEFTGSPASISARAGAKFSAWDGYISGKNVELQDSKKIVQEWQTTEWPEGHGPSLLKISLKKRESGTELTMFQERVPASQVKQYDEGWHSSYWEPLKQYFEGKKSNP